jgi:hypothetical protein
LKDSKSSSLKFGEFFWYFFFFWQFDNFFFKTQGIFGEFLLNFHICANFCTQEKNAGKDTMAMANSGTKGWVSMECGLWTTLLFSVMSFLNIVAFQMAWRW